MSEEITPIYKRINPLFGISNGHGGFWSDQYFYSEEAAIRHMESCWGASNIPDEHKVVRVRVRIEEDTAS